MEEIREDFLEEEDLHGLILDLRSVGNNLVSHPSTPPPTNKLCHLGSHLTSGNIFSHL